MPTAQCSEWYEISDMEIQIHQQTKGLIMVFSYKFNQVLVLKSEEIPNIYQKFNKNTVQSANPFFNSWI